MVNRTRFYDLDRHGEVIDAPMVDNSYKWAGGGFLSTTKDLIKFGEANFGPGYLSESTLTLVTTSQQLASGKKTNYGIGWEIYQDGYGHSGGSVGGITYFRIYPESRLILVLLSNASHTEYGNVPEKIADLFLNNTN